MFDDKINAEVGDTVRYNVWAVVNGVTTDKIERQAISYLFIPKRKIVVEEGTGMWCTYCPKGIVAMETLAEKYPDSFIGLVLHYDDPLEVEGYSVEMNFPGFPSAYVNRKYMVKDVMPQTLSGGEMVYTTMAGGLESNYLSAMSDMSVADLSFRAESQGYRKVKAEVTTRFALGVDDADYQIAIVVVENDVTNPDYFQENGMSGSDVPMGGYEALPDRIQPFTFQEVVRCAYDDYKGIPGSVPASIKAGEDNVFSYEVAIPETVTSIANTKLVAMLIDMKTGEIMNAASIDADVAGVDNVIAPEQSTLNYRIDGGKCVVDLASGSLTSSTVVSFYSANGMLLSSKVLEADSSCEFDVDGLSGLHFITVAQDNKTTAVKVIL